MNKIYKKIIFSYMFCVIISIFTIFIMSLITFMTASVIPGLIGIILCVTLSLYIFFIRLAKRNEMSEYLTNLGTSIAQIDIFTTLPMPAAVLRANGNIIWSNQHFTDIFGETIFDIPITSIIPDLNWNKLLKANKISTDINFDNRHFKITGNLIREESSEKSETTIILYFDDCTKTDTLELNYQNEKIDVAVINIDNYEDFLLRVDDSKRQECLTQIDKLITEWVSQSNGMRRRIDRDRYLVLFEHQYLQSYIDKKFDILDKIRAINESIKYPITVSIGVGIGSNVNQNDKYAADALNVVLGRGGDQAAVKDETQFTFYGGTTKEYEKNAKVKVRSFALALKDYILKSDQVILMGHSTPDYDAFGAMMGLQSAVTALGKQPYIILDNTIGIQKLLNEANTMPEYSSLFIDSDTASELVTENTLVIIADTHRPSMLPCPQLLSKVNSTVLIDHHIRNLDFIDCSLIYHETYVSSTCEMVTEIMQYITDTNKLNNFEAKALYVGLLMDTKNFVMKTGTRTFEAASYLKKRGVDTILVRSLFNIGIDEYSAKVDIVKQSEILPNGIAISVCTNPIPNIRIISSQAADEMLCIENVSASFVLFEENNAVGISGRSIADINVQTILEKLGGGGHSMLAGAKISDASIEDVKNMLIDKINEYFEELTK